MRRIYFTRLAFAAAITFAAGVLLSPATVQAQACTGACTTTVTGTDIVHTFTGAGTFTPPTGVGTVTYLVVGGGGAGGGITTTANVGGAGGGGAGGYQAGAGFAVGAGPFTITVGAGGTAPTCAGTCTGPGGTGGPSSFSTVTANGGGGGASVGTNNGQPGGSGGGGRASTAGGTGSQGNAGGTGGAGGAGGGGGSNAVGAVGTATTGGAGGGGISNSITGVAVNYAGGGGGGGYTGASGAGGATGGGAGGAAVRTAGTAGTANTGGGGGGARGNSSGATAANGSAGGSGVVIIRYTAPSGRFGVATGNWSATTTWAVGSCSGTPGAPVPTNTDAVTICNGDNVTVNVVANAASVTVQSGGTLTQSTQLTIAGALDVQGSMTSSAALSVGTTTDVDGTLNLGATGKTFSGDVTVNGTWNETAAVTIGFAGNLTNNATSWTANTAAHTFSGANKTISGTTAVVIPSVNVTGTYTNVNTLTVSTTLSGGGTLTNGNGVAAATLNIGMAVANLTLTTLTANAANNTVIYNRAGIQTVKTPTAGYRDLELAGTSAKTLVNTLTSILGDLSLTGTASATTVVGLNIGGNLSVGAGTTFTVPAFAIDVNQTTTVAGTLSLTSATGAKTFDGATEVQNGGILDLRASSPTFGSTVDVRNGGIMRFATATGGTKTYNGKVTIDAGGQLQASQATTVDFNADVEVNGVWNETAAVVMDFAGNLLNNASAWTASTGTHTFSGTGKTISGGTTTSIANTAVTGTYTNVNTLTVGTALTGGGTLTNGDGTNTALLNIGGTSTVTNLTASAANNTVNYTGAGQTIKTPTTSTYNNLTFSGSGSKTAAAGLTVNGDLTFSNPGTAVFAGSTFTHTFKGNWVVNTTVASTPFTFGAGSTVNFNAPNTPAATSIGGSTTQTITFNNVNVNNTSGFNVNDNISAAGTLTVAADVTLTPSATSIISGGGTLTGPAGPTFGTVQVTRTAATADFSSQYTITTKTLGFLTVEYVGATQTVSAITYAGNLTINNASGPTLAAGTTTVTKTLTLTAGTLTVGARTLVLNGPTIAGTPANLATINTSNLTFGGSSSGVNVPSSVLQLLNLTVNNTNGITLNSSPTINGVLTFTLGNVLTGSNTLILPAAGSVSRTSGHVVGNLRKNVATSAGSIARTYEVGDAAAYSPVTVTFASVGTAGNLTATVTAGEHPDVASSEIGSNANVNRYWTLTNSGIVFSNYSAAFTYGGVAGDVDVGAVPANFGIAKGDTCSPSCATWTSAAVSGTPTATNAATTSSLTGFSDFVVGQRVTNFLVEASGGGNITAQTEDTPFTIKITARDAADNVVTGFTGTVQISTGCNLFAGGGTTVSFVNGVLASHSVTIADPSATCAITATRTGGSAAGTSNSFAVLAAVTSFDGCETTSPACTPGVADFNRLFTKLANTAFTLDLVAIKSGGTLNTDFHSKNATIDLLANTSVQSTGANSCPASATSIISLGSLSFSTGRRTVAIANTAFSGTAPNYSAYRDVRARVTCDATNCPPSGITWCSADNFAVRPGSFAVGTPTLSAPPNTVLSNAAQTGAPAGVAGADFTVTLTAVAGYNGQPVLTRSLAGQKVVTHAGAPDYTDRLRDTGGGSTVTFPAATIGTGVSTATLQYHDAGNFQILADGIVDSAFSTGTDDSTKDCVAGSSSTVANGQGKYGCNIGHPAAGPFGRFYPDRYELSGGTVTPACVAGGFTYMGHAAMGLGYTLSAMSQNNAVTLKLSKFTSGYGTLATVNVLSENGAVATDLTSNLTPSLAYNSSNWSAGDYAVTGSAFNFARTTPAGPYESFYIGAGVTDADGAPLNGRDFKLGDPACTTSCTHKLLSATPTKIRFGRLRLLNAIGAETLNLPVTLRAEYWNGSGFLTHTDDSCTALAATPAKKFVLYGHQGGVTAGNMVSPTGVTDGNVSATGTFSGGTTSLVLLKPSPPATSPGSVRVCLDLDAGAGGDTSCQANQPANLTHLQGNWDGGSTYDKDPNARSAFGLYGSQPRQFIFFREGY